MTILILGGIAESKALAQALIRQQQNIIYSIAGLVRTPELECAIHVGGFSTESMNGTDGLIQYCKDQKINLIIDATHPYAAEMSENAVAAATVLQIQCWRFERPGWNPNDYENWSSYNDINDLLGFIEPYYRPFFSIGKSALQYYHLKPDHQKWVIRSAKAFEDHNGVIQINAIGPFDLAQEIELLKTYQIDCLISKNSGCSRVAAKMQAALQLGIPAFVQTRPVLAECDRVYGDIEQLVAAIIE